MRGKYLPLCLLTLLLIPAGTAQAHFGMIIPDRNLIEPNGPKTIALHCLFWHPMENKGMDMAKPRQLGLLLAGHKSDLTASLKEKKVDGRSTWTTTYQVRRPGDHVFFLDPTPYWEPAEDKWIAHYAKTVVSALGAQEGWDQPVGQPMEILPLTRPYGLYAGNAFTGQVLFKGKPLAGARVEVEFYNQDGKRKAPGDAYVAQVVKTDLNGVFTWAMPWAGWWGFSALADDDQTMPHDGQPKRVELGGVLWLLTAPAK